jgi:hypothetical protein
MLRNLGKSWQNLGKTVQFNKMEVRFVVSTLVYHAEVDSLKSFYEVTFPKIQHRTSESFGEGIPPILSLLDRKKGCCSSCSSHKSIE